MSLGVPSQAGPMKSRSCEVRTAAGGGLKGEGDWPRDPFSSLIP